MIRMRLLTGLFFLIACSVRPLFGQPACEICRGEWNMQTGTLRIWCGTPNNDSWASENCTITVQDSSISCSNEPQNCYYTESLPPPPPPTDPINDCQSPIIIDVAGDGYALTDAAQGVSFDINGDGVANRIGWTSAGSDDAFLWLDANGNGVVDNGVELFGDAVHDNGFDKLKTFDGNGDGVIDGSDAVWPTLRLWVDSNHNGASEVAEISRLAGSRFNGISVGFKIVGKRDRYGNRFRYKGLIYTTDRTNGADRVYDVIFVQAQ